MRKTTTWLVAFSLVLALPAIALAGDPVRDADAAMYPGNVRYDSGMPTPEAFLGRPLGAAPVRYHELVRYITTLAGLSDRLTVEVIGYSHERRPILFVVATSPENQADIEAIRQQHVALTEPDIDQDVTPEMPVVTWLNYGVHGAESSGMDASLPTLYYLAAAQGPGVDQLLSSSVILLTAAFNPDGHANRIAWLDTFGSNIANPDPNHIEHNYDGRLARTNHYGFDLNRQWISVTQPEARAWMRKWHEWRPNVSVDYHEMGSNQTYYFSPGVAIRTHPLIPDEGMQLVRDVVRPAEAFFDAEARLYFHGDRYDHFFLGKGAAFPLINGGIGILHEASSARGSELETVNGLRTYRENVRKHFRTSIANAEGAQGLRRELLTYQQNFYDSAADAARSHPIKAYVFSAGDDEARLYHFVDLLNFHRIKVYDLAQNITESGVTYRAGQAMIMPLSQAQHRLIRSLFETMTEFKDPKFYDVSTWTLPLAFGLDYAALSSRRLNADLVGGEVSLQMPVAGTPDVASYAYVFEWSGYYAPRALNRVLTADIMARVAPRSFVAQTTRGSHEFQRGSIVISFDRQEVSRDEIREIMIEIAAQDGIFVHAVTSGRSVIGTAGPELGGQFFKPLDKPEVLLIVGREMDWYNAGEIWHLLDKRMRMPVTLRDRSRLGDIKLHRYTHLIFAGGEFGDYAPEYAGRIRQWVSDGGTIIGIRQGADWVRENVLDYVEPEYADGMPVQPESVSESGHELLPEELPEVVRLSYAQKEAQDAVDVIGGAIFSGDLDVSHPLGYGYSRRAISLPKNTKSPLERPPNPYATVIAYSTPPLGSGYASTTNKDALEGTAALIAERMGEGSVILFADDPNFRAIWYGTNKLFLNALFFSKAFDPPPKD